MNSLSVPISLEPDARDLSLPSYATAGAAGLDLRAAVREEVTLPPGGRVLIPTGIRVALPDGFEAQVRPRSGLALHHGVTLLNAPGTIDSDYRGVVSILLINMGQEPYTIKRGDRVAQMVVAPVARVTWQAIDALPDAARGEGGFGHTGTGS